MNIVFAGTPAFAVPCLQALIDSDHQIMAVYTQPDRPAGRGRRLTASAVKQLALQYQLPVCQPTRLSDEMIQSTVAQHEADLWVVVAYGLLLPPSMLTLPRWGAINVHASLLPRWRGAAPIQAAILAGDRQTGITIMQMDEGLDTGAMLADVRCTIEPQEIGQTLHDKLAKLAPSILLEVIDQLSKEALVAHAQEERLATYAAKITKQMARIDWRQSAEQIDRQIRAFNPWPVAFSDIAGQTVRIYQAQPLDQQTTKAGEILHVSTAGIIVACGTGCLQLQQIQLPGSQPLPVAEIIKAPRSWLVTGHCFQ
ncbi:MAG: methionyl-tRNA formyltransferase [Legionellales bacterium]|nr:methionyl-tRNA formyltransferase [Legionellales bacterium]